MRRAYSGIQQKEQKLGDNKLATLNDGQVKWQAIYGHVSPLSNRATVWIEYNFRFKLGREVNRPEFEIPMEPIPQTRYKMRDRIWSHSLVRTLTSFFLWSISLGNKKTWSCKRMESNIKTEHNWPRYKMRLIIILGQRLWQTWLVRRHTM